MGKLAELVLRTSVDATLPGQPSAVVALYTVTVLRDREGGLLKLKQWLDTIVYALPVFTTNPHPAWQDRAERLAGYKLTVAVTAALLTTRQDEPAMEDRLLTQFDTPSALIDTIRAADTVFLTAMHRELDYLDHVSAAPHTE